MAVETSIKRGTSEFVREKKFENLSDQRVTREEACEGLRQERKKGKKHTNTYTQQQQQHEDDEQEENE